LIGAFWSTFPISSERRVLGAIGRDRGRQRVVIETQARLRAGAGGAAPSARLAGGAGIKVTSRSLGGTLGGATPLMRIVGTDSAPSGINWRV